MTTFEALGICFLAVRVWATCWNMLAMLSRRALFFLSLIFAMKGLGINSNRSEFHPIHEDIFSQWSSDDNLSYAMMAWVDST